jgi:hypothetical protein
LASIRSRRILQIDEALESLPRTHIRSLPPSVGANVPQIDPRAKAAPPRRIPRAAPCSISLHELVRKSSVSNAAFRQITRRIPS